MTIKEDMTYLRIIKCLCDVRPLLEALMSFLSKNHNQNRIHHADLCKTAIKTLVKMKHTFSKAHRKGLDLLFRGQMFWCYVSQKAAEISIAEKSGRSRQISSAQKTWPSSVDFSNKKGPGGILARHTAGNTE